MNNFENIVNHRVDIREDIKCYQDTLSYASSKADYSVGENMLPSDMDLNIRSRAVGYNNKILVSNGKFSLGKNDKVNARVLKPVISMPKVMSHKIIAQPTHAHELARKTTHKEEKIAFVLFLAGGFAIWNIFSMK